MKNMDINDSLETANLYEGKVITPAVASVLQRELPRNPPPKNSYGVIGCISENMYRQALASPANTSSRLTAFETPLAQTLLVLTIQVESCQARLLMHLADPQVQEMLIWSAKSSYMQVLLAVPGRLSVVYFHPPFFHKDLAQLLALGKENKAISAVDTITEMAGSAMQLSNEKQKLVCPGMQPVTLVTVSTILWHPDLPITEVTVNNALRAVH
jgi:hypothetical protein